MIIISDCNKDIVIPAGLGDNPGVVYETAGVKSLNGETGDLKIKTVNGNELLGEGNIEIKGGVETVNGETGDVKIKTVNGQSLMGEGDVPVDVGVETLNGQKGDLKIKSVNGAEMLGEGNVAIDTGVESLNGQKGALTLKTVNGNELTGDGNIEIQAGVESVNGETGNVIVKSLKYFDLATDNSKEAYEEIANHWDDQKGYTGDFIFRYKKGQSDFTFDEIGYLKGHSVFFSYLNNAGAYDLTGDIKCFAIIIWYEDGKCSLSTYEKDYTFPKKVSQLTNDSGYQTKAEVDTAIENAVSGAGSDDVIVLDGLTQEERKAVYDKLDKTKAPNAVFIWENSPSFNAFWEGDYAAFDSFKVENKGLMIHKWYLKPDGNVSVEIEPYMYVNSLFLNLRDHVDENADFNCDYYGDYQQYMTTDNTYPNSYYIKLPNGIGDTNKYIFTPVTVVKDGPYDHKGIRIQFTANEKLYTYLHGDADGKWLFESAKPITGGGATNALTYKQITNENRQEVYDDVKAHWSDASGYTGNYVYFYQKDKDQIIFDEVKFENNEAYFNSAAINYTSGQVHNPLIRLLCCIIRPEESMELAENKRVISDINGMRYICGGVINDGDSISFTTNNYGDGYDIYESTNTGGRDGMFDAQFENGIGGYKGNTPANIFTDGTDVFMAFDVVDNHYVYKKVDNSWAFVSKTKIGGVQSSEVSNIKVLTQAEYDALTAKDENVLYCIKG